MDVSRIQAFHFINVRINEYYIIYYTDTVTGITASIKVTNNLATMTTFDWCTYFVTNSVYSNTLFSTEIIDDSFVFQAKKSNIIFTNYKGFYSLGGEILSGFTSDITTVTVPDVAPIPQDLPIDERTPIDGANKIKFCNSPLYLRHTIANDET